MANEFAEELAEKTAEIVSALRAKPIISSILSKLKKELPNNLAYHSVEHTEEVLQEVIVFATYDNKTQREVELLAVAAAYHDAGFLELYNQNEPIGAMMAEKAMRESGEYSAEEQAQVKSMILDTALKQAGGLHQEASTDLAKYLLDADLANYGRKDFFIKLDQLVMETDTTRAELLQKTLTLGRNHDWQTEAARTLRQPQKERNLALIKKEIESK